MLPSASVGGPVPLFEPVHGSAPDLAGRSVANPTGALLSAAMLLEHAGYPAPAEAIRAGVAGAFAAGIRTRDLGGDASTTTFTNAVLDHATALPA